MTERAAGSTVTPAASLRHAPLTADEVGRLHGAALELLASRGVAVAGETALELLTEAGASVERTTGRVRLPVALVARAVAAAPASFVLPGRVADRDVTIGGGR
ncbi:MAG: trimethylamine methyltransferase family protein, partial [Thermoleophilia bacterium]